MHCRKHWNFYVIICFPDPGHLFFNLSVISMHKFQKTIYQMHVFLQSVPQPKTNESDVKSVTFYQNVFPDDFYFMKLHLERIRILDKNTVLYTKTNSFLHILCAFFLSIFSSRAWIRSRSNILNDKIASMRINVGIFFFENYEFSATVKNVN